MKQYPKISIITPSLNQVKYLEQTIQSVLKQDYPNLEYIIMDGGSTDGSIDVIKSYEKKLAHWVSKPDQGQASAINQGMKIASGDILAWINSDDTYEPNVLTKIADVFLLNSEIRLVYGEGWYIDKEGNRIRPCKFIRHTFTSKYMYNKDPILQQSSFWRKDLWDETGPLDESLYWVFDWDWFIRASRRTDFYYLPHFIANYRVHSEAKTRSGNIQRHRELAHITRKYGRWWYPNSLTQSCRILEFRILKMTSVWPPFIRRFMRRLGSAPRTLVEEIFYGRYSN